MADEDLIAQMTDISGDGIPILYEYDINPFTVVDPTHIGFTRKELCRSVHSNRTNFSRMSLQDRTLCFKPRVSPFETRSTRLVHSSMSSLRPKSSFSIPITPVNKQRTLLMNELVQQKRDIYKCQLSIDRMNRDIKRFRTAEIQRQEQQEKDEAKITKALQKDKMKSIKLQELLIKARKSEKIAEQKRNEMEKQRRQLQQSVDQLRSQLFKNEEPKELLTSYKEFLETLTPDGKNTLEYFSSPKVLIEELHHLENSTLVLITQCRKLEDALARDNEAFMDVVETKLGEEGDLEKIINERQRVVDDYNSQYNDRVIDPFS